MLNVEALLALLQAGAVLVGQESVKLATKQAYDALRGKLTQVLGKPAVDAAEKGDAGGLSAQAIGEKLRAVGEAEAAHLDQALDAVMSDPELGKLMPCQLFVSLRDARFRDGITFDVEDHVTNSVIDASRVRAGSFSYTAKKNTQGRPL